MVVLDIQVPNWIKSALVLEGKAPQDLGRARRKCLIEREASKQPL